MTDILLHNYPASPVAEKVRKGLGLKGLSWGSVEIPRLPPKPDLVCLTGGYRRTPVMQIGADIYCDSQGILREIERRFPEPTFFPGGAGGMAWAVSRWTDGPLFDISVKVILGAAGDALDPAFAADRGRLYLGPDWAEGLKAAGGDLPHLVSQLRAQLSWPDERVSGGRDFMLGAAPGLPDVLVWHLVWFLRGRWADGPAFLSEFKGLAAWEARMDALGHGTMREVSAEEAIAIARGSETATPESADPGDPQGLTPGTEVTVTQDGDGGDPVVSGTVRAVSAQSVSILRTDARVGTVCVHFPRAGYRVTRVG